MTTYSQSDLDSILSQLTPGVSSASATPNYAAYVDNNPDLLALFNSQQGMAKGRTKEQFGQYHWANYGQGEGRPFTPTGAAQGSSTGGTGGTNQFIANDGQVFTDDAAMRQHNIDLQNTQLTSQRSSAVNRATTNANQAFMAAGVDPSQYSDQINQSIQQILSGIPQGDTDPAGYFPDSLGSSLLALDQSKSRNQYRQQINNTFTPNYDTNAVGDDLLSTSIQDLLTQQGQGASDALNRAQARGQINDVGFAGGSTTLNNDRTAALSKLNSIANDVLTGYRSKIDDVANSARTAASSYQLGDTFDLNDYISQAGKIAGQAKTNAAGDFLNQVGDTPLFDLNQILGNAGNAQGAVNLQDKDVLAAVDAKKKTDQQARGLGSQGSF